MVGAKPPGGKGYCTRLIIADSGTSSSPSFGENGISKCTSPIGVRVVDAHKLNLFKVEACSDCQPFSCMKEVLRKSLNTFA